MATVRWLALEARVSARSLNLARIIELWPVCAEARSRNLLEAVQVLVGVATCRGWGARGVVSHAVERGDLALVQCLQEKQRHQQQELRPQQGQLGQQQGLQHGQLPGWPDGTTVQDAAEAGCEALLEWLVERHPGCLGVGREPGPCGARLPVCGQECRQGHACRPAAAWRAVGYGGRGGAGLRRGCELRVLRWLVEQGAPVGSTGDMEEAVARRVRGGGRSAEEATWLRGLAGAAEAGAAKLQRQQ